MVTFTTMQKLDIESRDFFTVPEAAKQLGKPKMTLYRWIHDKKLITVTFGGITFVPKSEIERLSGNGTNQLK